MQRATRPETNRGRALTTSMVGAWALLGLGLVAPGCDGGDRLKALSSDPEAIPAVPPISGGTLVVLADGRTVVASDPDRDRVSLVDLETDHVVAIPLSPKDEPGRVAEDGAGRVHVVLRGGGAVVTIDPAAARVVDRRPVCPAPRGIAYDKKQDLLHVACVGGDLVSLPAAGGEPARRVRLDSDLRDIVVRDDGLLVSRFRSAEILAVDGAGKITARTRFPSQYPPGKQDMIAEPAVAWRMIPLPGGLALVVHQREAAFPILLASSGGGPPYYGGPHEDASVVHAAVSVLRAPGEAPHWSPTMPFATLPVDVAVTQDGSTMAMIATGSALLITGPTDLLEIAEGSADPLDEGFTGGGVTGEPIAVAFDPAGQVIVQTRQPASLRLQGRTIDLHGDRRSSPGHTLFHMTPFDQGSLSCASCHPEGRDDGHTWFFDPVGPRRTQSLLGDMLDTAPFHWDGDMGSLGMLMSEVFVHRMGADSGNLPQKTRDVEAWLSTLPAAPPSPPEDTAAVERGEALFRSDEVGCATCHAGPKHTNNETVAVGTGSPLQVPALTGVAWRAPFMHTGCAPTLLDRFGPCGGGDAHGKTSHLSPSEIGDLVAYLESL